MPPPPACRTSRHPRTSASPALTPTRIEKLPLAELTVVAIDRSLHRCCTGDGVGRSLIGDHQGVADRLDLGAAGRSDGFSKVGKVGATQLIRCGVTHITRDSVEPTRSVNRTVTRPDDIRQPPAPKGCRTILGEHPTI